MTDGITFEPVPPSHPDAESLMAMLDADVLDIYHGINVETGALSAELKADFNGVFLVARRNGVPVACGGVLVLDAATGELRRVYARPEARGSGLARTLVAELERAAAEWGLSRMLLETGDRQHRAIGFYEALGYTRIPPYGEHAGKWWSVCYEKRILPVGITFESASPDTPEVARLLAAYEAEFLSLHTSEESGWTGEAVHKHIAAMLLVRRDGQPVGCGGIRMRDSATAELKRMYVVPNERGRSIATEFIARLERMAMEHSASRMVLDTTERMTSAIRLYERLGYVPTESFGTPAPALLYFEKRLG